MKRRRALVGIAVLGVGLSTSLESRAQRPAKTPVIGLLDGGERLAWWTAFRQQMHELGYVDGKSVAYEGRFAKGKLEQLPSMAQELVRLEVALIVTSSSAAAQAASRATDKIPIVTASTADHVSIGLAASLARPGGNVTGVSSIASELTAKRLELLQEILPKMSRLAVLWQSDNLGSRTAVRDLERACRSAKVSLQNVGVKKAEEIAGAFSAATRERADAIFVILAPLTYGERQRIGELALKHNLPSMHGGAEFAAAGGLVSYGASYPDLFRRAAVYADKILKGAKPGELPIEEPTRFEMVLNLKTAKALNIRLPSAVLLRADRVID